MLFNSLLLPLVIFFLRVFFYSLPILESRYLHLDKKKGGITFHIRRTANPIV